jgi:nucleoside recognition membrane protein YjiH
MFSNSAVSIMESDIPLNVGKLVIIFFLRTLIAMPLVAIVTHFIF